jgi:hypothetical protein
MLREARFQGRGGAQASRGVRRVRRPGRDSSCSKDQACSAPRPRRHARRGVAVTEQEPGRPQGRTSAAARGRGTVLLVW